MSEYNPHQFLAKKALGQNFLIDQTIIHKIVRAANLGPNDLVIEVGPGPGALTFPIIKDHPKSFVLVEKDRDIAQYWQTNEGAGVTVLNQDALTLDLDAIDFGIDSEACASDKTSYKIISNLPYNVGTELLVNWLSLKNVHSMVLMFQKEVVNRIVATPKTKAYGRLSILTQWLCHVEKLFDVPPGAFKPAPKVTSSVVKITPRTSLLYPADKSKLEKITHACFHQRRKMLRKSLKPLFHDNVENVCQAANIDSSVRPEELTIEEFCRLANQL